MKNASNSLKKLLHRMFYSQKKISQLITYAPELHYYCYCYTRSFVRCISLVLVETSMSNCPSNSMCWWMFLESQVEILSIIFKAKRASYQKQFHSLCSFSRAKKKKLGQSQRKKKKDALFYIFSPNPFLYLRYLVSCCSWCCMCQDIQFIHMR